MPTRPPVQFCDEQLEFAAWVREFAVRHRDDYLRQAASEQYPWDMAAAMAEHGLLGMGTSAEHGGSGRIGEEISFTHLGIMQEELSYQNFYLCQLSYGATILAPLIERHLGSSQKDEWVRGIVEGRRVVSLGVTEPGSGGDAAALRTTARPEGDEWVLAGEKTSISYAPHAAGIVVLARTPGESGQAGFTAFLVPMDAHGVSRQTFADAGWRPIGRAGVFLDDVRVPDEFRLGPIGGGFSIVLREFDYARSVIGLMAGATGRRALDLAIDYARQREAFGHRVSAFQGVSFPIVDDAMALEAARWVSYRALSLADAGQRFTKEAAMGKHLGVEAALNAIRTAIVTHGHYGYSEELPLQAMLRDVAGLQLGEGTPQIQRLVVARQIFGREAV